MNTATFGWGIPPSSPTPATHLPAKSSENNQKLFETVRNGKWFLAYRERPTCKTFARTVTHTQQGTHKRTHSTLTHPHRALTLWHRLALQAESVADVAILSAGIQSWYKNKAETKRKQKKQWKSYSRVCSTGKYPGGAREWAMWGCKLKSKGIAEAAEVATVNLLKLLLLICSPPLTTWAATVNSQSALIYLSCYC